MQPSHTQTFGPTRRDIVVAEASSPAYQAYQVLHVGFVLLPLVAGLDKFTNWLTNWQGYLAPYFAQATSIPERQLMMIAGAIEIVIALIVAIKPLVGARLLALWMLASIVNLILGQSHFDLALRDFGIMLGALALGRLSIDFDSQLEVETP
jgi:hypothetical protein